MELSEYDLHEVDLMNSSYERALDAATRLFAFCDTKWTDLNLPNALRQIDDDFLACSLNLRRVLEHHGKTIDLDSIEPWHAEHSKTSAEEFENALWKLLGRVVHHKSIKPEIVTDHNFYQNALAHQIVALEVESDKGKSVVSLSGFAIAVTNELGNLYKNSTKGDSYNGNPRRRKHQSHLSGPHRQSGHVPL